ncbi:MAG: DUF4446 family protein [Candidatus Staskawiczbacteria bacterium]|nr:DUF4446 family protein [Candidatus Staskawiczbacteria bacterium]
MTVSTAIFSLLSAVILILFLINCLFLWRFYRTNKKMEEILESGKVKDFKALFLKQKEKNNEFEGQIKNAFSKIKELENISKRTIQKIGIVRFNPFNEMGGNQSFVIALLDDKNNGFVISSLFVKDGNRVYAKNIKQGKSDHLLSKEEVEAINRAISSKQ